MAQHDEEDRKLFVGGLPQDCTQEELKEYFTQFGELDKVQLKMDPTTGRSRGFAFLLFSDSSSLDAAVAHGEHLLKGKKMTAKKADIKPGKIYLGKLPDSGLSEDEIRAHFEEFGTVTEVIRPIDKMKNNEPKNFCFVTFERERVSRKLIDQGTCTINGHRLQIKPVTPNPRDPTSMGRGGGGMGMRGGRGGYAAGGYGGGDAYGGGGYGAGGYGAGGYGASGYGADAYGGAGGYGAGGYGGDASGGYGAGGYGGGYGADPYGGGAGGYGGYGGAPGGGKMMRGGRGGAPMAGGRGRGRGRPY